MRHTDFIRAAFAVLLLTVLAHASPGRTLFVHNNTNATLMVVVSEPYRSEVRTMEIPPLSNKSFFNCLRQGHNVVQIHTKYDIGVRVIVREFWVSGEETTRHSLELFPRDFGMNAMFDPPRKDTVQGTSPIAGTWQWCVNGDVIFYPDGTLTQGPRRGTWVHYNNGVTIKWSHGFTDVLQLSADKREMKGQGHANNNPGRQFPVWGRKK